MKGPRIWARLRGPTELAAHAISEFEAAGFQARLLLERSHGDTTWIEVRAQGTVREMKSIRDRADTVGSELGFSVREYGPAPQDLSS